MRTLMVLCAGNKALNKIPIFLNRHPNGKLLAEVAIEGIYPEKYTRIIYVVSRYDEINFNAKNVLIKELGGKYTIEVICLPMITQGPADTAYYAIRRANVKGEVTIRDSLNYIQLENEGKGNFIAGLDLTHYERDIKKLRTKSFILLNEQKNVLDVIEKKIKSDIISVGAYGFKKSSDFLAAYRKLKDPSYPIEIMYVSHIISYLIGYEQRIYHCVNALEYEEWGSEEAWAFIQRQYATYFVNMDMLCSEDDITNIPIKLIDKLHVISENGATIVFFTSRIDVDRDKIVKGFLDIGIRCKEVVCGISGSRNRMVIDTLEKMNGIVIEE